MISPEALLALSDPALAKEVLAQRVQAILKQKPEERTYLEVSIITRNPNLFKADLVSMCVIAPWSFLHNPALPLLMHDDPAFAGKVEDARRSVCDRLFRMNEWASLAEFDLRLMVLTLLGESKECHVEASSMVALRSLEKPPFWLTTKLASRFDRLVSLWRRMGEESFVLQQDDVDLLLFVVELEKADKNDQRKKQWAENVLAAVKAGLLRWPEKSHKLASVGKGCVLASRAIYEVSALIDGVSVFSPHENARKIHDALFLAFFTPETDSKKLPDDLVLLPLGHPMRALEENTWKDAMMTQLISSIENLEFEDGEIFRNDLFDRLFERADAMFVVLFLRSKLKAWSKMPVWEQPSASAIERVSGYCKRYMERPGAEPNIEERKAWEALCPWLSGVTKVSVTTCQNAPEGTLSEEELINRSIMSIVSEEMDPVFPEELSWTLPVLRGWYEPWLRHALREREQEQELLIAGSATVVAGARYRVHFAGQPTYHALVVARTLSWGMMLLEKGLHEPTAKLVHLLAQGAKKSGVSRDLLTALLSDGEHGGTR